MQKSADIHPKRQILSVFLDRMVKKNGTEEYKTMCSFVPFAVEIALSLLLGVREVEDVLAHVEVVAEHRAVGVELTRRAFGEGATLLILVALALGIFAERFTLLAERLSLLTE